jgi:hypothetical protein
MDFTGFGLAPTYASAASDAYRVTHKDHSLQMALDSLVLCFVLGKVPLLHPAQVLKLQIVN